MTKAALHDGSANDVEVSGAGPALLLPVNPTPVEGPQADEMRKWGADRALGRTLIDGLNDRFRVVAFDYEGGVMAVPKPDTLRPANVAGDSLAVADAVGADRFAYYGYSWLAIGGLQLAVRTDRLLALVMGGFPPIDGPYAQMLRVTTAAHKMSVSASVGDSEGSQPAPPSDGAVEEFDWSTVQVSASEGQTRQFVTLYEALQGFDDGASQERLACPRLCFAGSRDEIEYGPRWGDVRVSLAKPLLNKRDELESFGWDVEVLDGLDHTQAMQATQVLPMLRPWLLAKLGISS